MAIDTSDALEQSAETPTAPKPPTAQTALCHPNAAPATGSITAPAATDTSTSGDCVAQSVDDRDLLHRETSHTGHVAVNETAASQHTPAIRPAHRILITAITDRIAQQRLTAAQTATALHLTGPRATRLLLGDADEFSLDELASMLPALELTIQVVSASHRQPGRSQAFTTNH